jgi:hypothetical protein
MIAAGRVVADGPLKAILAGRQTVRVVPERWESAFTVLQRAALRVALVGRTLRVPDADLATVSRVLDAEGLRAAVDVVPATFEEVFVTLAFQDEAPPPVIAASHGPPATQ